MTLYFYGDIHQVKRPIDLRFILGIRVVLTFKKGKIDQLLNEIAVGKIVLETDSPYLAPVTHRGK